MISKLDDSIGCHGFRFEGQNYFAGLMFISKVWALTTS